MDELTDLLRTQPEQALGRMLSDYGGLVYFVVRGILTDCPAEDVEECVSDAFLYHFEHRARLDFSRGSVKAYLCTVAKNKAYDRLRRLRRERAVSGSEEVRSAAAAPSAEELALCRVERGALVEAIVALGEPDTRILIGRYYLGLRTAEIASLVGMRENSVDQRARRALKRLLVQLEGGVRYAK